MNPQTTMLPLAAVAIINEVHARTHIWDSYDQGRLARAIGAEPLHNPHIVGHINYSDWTRGYNAEVAA